MTSEAAIDAPVILIVAEAPAELGSLPRALQRRGMAIRIAAHAEEALALLAAGGIALALIDTALRHGSGFELCRLIKAGASTRQIPVLLMTDAPDPAERRRSSECGACDYLHKPVDPARVIEKILVQLALRRTPVLAPDTAQALPAMHALEVNYHAMLAGSPDSVVLIDLDSARLVDVNSNACTLFGLSEQALLAASLYALCPPTQPDGQTSAAALGKQVRDAEDGAIRLFEATFRHSSGRPIACEMRLVLLPTPGRRLMHARIVDITRRAKAEQLRVGQTQLLELIARGAPLTETLDKLVLLIESQSDDLLCSVMLLDEDGVTMRSASGPNLPSEYMAALDGIPIGPAVGSCGTAMFRRETVIVDDVLTDPLWAPYHALVAPFGLRACWSTPIYLDKEHLLGSFAMYYHSVRRPDGDDMRLVAVATHLAGIAIERPRRERELVQHRQHLEVLVARRTAELTLAKERVEHANEELAATLDTLSLAQEELVRRDKLAALGSLVAGIAHELNTPIGNSLVVATTMAEQARSLAARLSDGERGVRRSELDSFLARTEEANDILARNLKRAARLVSSFKQLAVDQSGAQRDVFNAGELIANMLPALRVAARNRPVAIEVSADLAPGGLGLDMDSYPGRLTEVLTSLFENCLLHAFDASLAGSIHISAKAEKGAGAGTGGMVMIAVSDNGAGIPAAVAGRVYDPFFTTKLGSGGSGLGLHVVHNVVTGMLGGRIELHSEPGQGTRFCLLLPAVAPASATAVQADAERA